MPRVGRRRTKDKHLPRGVYLSHGAYYFAQMVDGRKRWTRLGTEYSEALARLAALAAARAPGGTFEALAARYEVEGLPRLSERHRRNRAADLKRLTATFGAMPVTAIKPWMVREYWTRAGETEGARHEIRTLGAVLSFARLVGLVEGENPCSRLNLPRSAPRKRYVTDEELQIVLSVAPPMMRAAAELAVIAGMDGATIRALERRHLTDRGIEFVRPKLAARDPAPQVIEWSPELRRIVRDVLAERPQVRQALICGRKGQPYTLDGFQAQWQRVMRKALKAGLPERFHFHDLRAKSASDAASDQDASDRLGHADPGLTRRVYRRLPRVAKPLK